MQAEPAEPEPMTEFEAEPELEPESEPPLESEGAEFSEQGQLPQDFPADLPVYPGAESDQGLSIPGQGLLVTFSTVAASDEVRAYYADELPKRGWTLLESEGEHRIVARKDDQEVSIMIMAAGSLTEIGVSVQAR